MNHKAISALALIVTLAAISLLPTTSRRAQEPGFTEPFDDPTLPGWDYSPNARVDGGVLRIESGGFAFRPGQWGDFTLDVRLRWSGDGAALISYRVTDQARYTVRFGGGSLVLQRESSGTVTELGSASIPIPPNEWAPLGVAVVGGQLKISLHGQPRITATDPEPLPPGGISLAASSGATGEFDDLVLTLSSGLPPQVEATSATAPTKTSSSEAGPLPPGVDPNWGWGLLLKEDFDSLDSLHPSWDIYGGLLAIAQDGDVSYGVLGQDKATMARAGSMGWENYALTLRIRLAGSTEFAILTHEGFRQDRADPVERIHYGIIVEPGPAGGSTVRANALGDQEGAIPIPIPLAPATLQPGEWHEITMIRRDDFFKLYIDGEEKANQDMSALAPSSAGGFRVQHVSGADLQIDQVTLFGETPKPEWNFLAAPTGGELKYIWPDPTNPSVLILGVSHSGVWATYNEGNTWDLMHLGLNSVDLAKLYMNPYDPKMLIEATGGGSAYVTHDAGNRWQNVAYEDAGCVGKMPFAFSEQDPQRVYSGAGGPGYVCRSDDDGRYFQRPDNPTATYEGEIAALTVVYTGGEEAVWVSTDKGQIGRSVNGGTSWEFYPNGANAVPDPVHDFYVLTKDPMRLYALTDTGLYYTTSDPTAASLAYVSWSKMNTLPSGGQGLIRAPEGTFYFIAGGVVLYSFDENGANVQTTEFPFLAPINDIALDNAQPNALLLASKFGLHRFDVQTRQLTALHDKIGAMGVLSIAVDPQYPPLVWAGTWFNGIVYSLDYGQTWHRAFEEDQECVLETCKRDEVGSAGYYSLKIDPNNGCNIFAAGTHMGGDPVFIASHDHGRTWSRLTAAEGVDSDYITDVEFYPKDTRVIYAAAGCANRYFGFSRTCEMNPQGLYRSEDGGRSFIRVGAPLGYPSLTSVAVHPEDDRQVWVGTPNAGLWFSDDGGKTFARMGKESLSLNYIVDVVVDPGNPQALYAGGGTVYENYWNNKGMPWDELSAPAFPERLHKSTNGGRTWTPLDLPSMTLEQIVVDPNDSNKIYVNTHSPGVWFSADGGQTWDLIDEGMLYFNETSSQHNYVFGLTVSPDSQNLYAGSCGRGIFRTGAVPAGSLSDLPACEDAGVPPSVPVEATPTPGPTPAKPTGGIPCLGGAIPLALVGLAGWHSRRARRSRHPSAD